MRNRFLLCLDIILLGITPALALALRLDKLSWDTHYRAGLLYFTLLALGIKLLTFFLFGLYRRYWRYASINELLSIIFSVGVATMAVTGMFFAAGWAAPKFQWNLPRSVPLIDGLLTLMAVGGIRFSVRVAASRKKIKKAEQRTRVLIVGAGDAGSVIAREMQTSAHLNVEPVGFVDDDRGKLKKSIHGLPVLGTCSDIPKLVKKYKVEEVILALPTAPGKKVREIRALCEAARVPSRTMPGVYELVSGQVSVAQLRNLDIEDLLRREPVQTDCQQVGSMLAGKRVLVTGAGGSIGSELCRQIAQCRPASLTLLGHGENSLFTFEGEMRARWPQLRFKVLVADIRDFKRLQSIFQATMPEVVFHAAAHKHVPMMEANSTEAVTNNVKGTQTLLELSEKFAAERFVLISSDKAVNPSNVMGATKRVAEKLVQAMAQKTQRPYVSVRFGNVLGSRGSVVNTFREQIARGGPVTVTHPEVKRYFMTIPEAVQLVLQAATLAGSECHSGVFVLDMGDPIKIADLAQDLIELSGKQVGRDIDIVYSGLRPGEKLFEELFNDGEQYRRTCHEKIFVAEAGVIESAFTQQLADLIAAAESGEDNHVRRILRDIIPSYQPAGK